MIVGDSVVDFFFQAEDGIRDYKVTGVQTCALPISFGGDWFHTKDAAVQDEDGYVWYVGRADDVIIAAGYRIGPFEVESACLEHPAVREAAVVASPDELRGNVVKAFVVLADGFEPTDALAAEIKTFVRDRLSAYAYPRKIEF